MEDRENKTQALYLTCEKYYIFELLIFAGGMMGAYTYNLRGGVFCNAQTANVVLMALAFGHGQWQFFIVEKSFDMRYNKLLNFSGVTGDYGKLVLAGEACVL